MAVEFVCSWCGSARVARDAWAEWDTAAQAWRLGTVFDDGFCHVCECERSLAEVAVDVPVDAAA